MRALAFGLLLLAGCAFPDRAYPQTRPVAYVYFGLIQDGPRAELIRRYNALDRSPAAHEYGFCAVNLPARDGTPNIVAVMFPKDSGSSPSFVLFTCPPGAMRGHVHPPAACDSIAANPHDVVVSTCHFGDAWGHQCAPSPLDAGVSLQYEGPSLVQCDHEAFVFYRGIPADTTPLPPVKPPQVPPLQPTAPR
jgi:hypothetical protein